MKIITPLAILTLLLGITACEDTKAKTAQQAEVQNKPKPACCQHEEELNASDEVTEESIYQLDSKWKDATGKESSLKSLAGHIQVFVMGYTTCEYACPRLLADMEAIDKKLPENVREKIHFTFVSIDPERDTPSRLAEYRKEKKITSDRWSVLTGDASSVQELAVVLGFKYRKTSATDFAHSNIITVLNEKGEIIHREQGLGIDPKETIKVITQALAD